MKTYAKIGAWVAGLLLLIVFYGKFLLPRMYESLADRGLYGDSFGALNVFISGCAFICLLYSLRQQEKQIVDNKRDFDREIQIMSAQASNTAASNEALIRQLRLMQISSRLSVLPTLIEAELQHIEKHHEREIGEIQIRSQTTEGLCRILTGAKKERDILLKIHSGELQFLPCGCTFIGHRPAEGHYNCFLNNLNALYTFHRDLFSLYHELSKDDSKPISEQYVDNLRRPF